MGDMGDLWRDVKAFRKERKEANYKRINPEQQLRDAGYSFESKNYGLHLIIRVNGKTINFWPTTGKWRHPAGRGGYGIANLLKYLSKLNTGGSKS
jgi:hypothetical protein